jgi:N-acetylmuramoyl-L-alanine amidase
MRTKFLLVAICFWGTVHAAAVQVEGLRLWAAPDNTRVVLDVNSVVKHEVFTLADPPRVVIDLQDATLRAPLPQPAAEDRLVRKIRSATRRGDDLRVVLDLRAPVRPKSFRLKPNRTYGHRLVVDLRNASLPEHRSRKVEPTDFVSASGKLRDVVVAIDAGHGGEDPGARGRRGTDEKDITLSIARRLAVLVRKEPGMRPLLIRDGDYYLGLRNRIEKARRHRADLFISVHADAFRDRRVKGASVYTLSRSGASNEAARWLAERENASDLVGGVSLEDKDDVLASVLLDLSQRASIEASYEFARHLLRRLRSVGAVHKPTVQHAGFAVLKSPDIPSVLVETAFISNPREERRLRDPKHQRKVARALMKGIRSYFYHRAPPGTWIAARKHVIASGDTLSEIAVRYRVSLSKLRVANGIKGDLVRIGQVLNIPTAGDS